MPVFPNPPKGETQLRDPARQTPHGEFADQAPDLLAQLVQLLVGAYGVAAPATLFGRPNLRQTLSRQLPKLYAAMLRARGPIAVKRSVLIPGGTTRSFDRFGGEMSSWHELTTGPRGPAGAEIRQNTFQDPLLNAHEGVHALYSAKGLPAAPPTPYVWPMFSHFSKKYPSLVAEYGSAPELDVLSLMRELVVHGMAKNIVAAAEKQGRVTVPKEAQTHQSLLDWVRRLYGR